MSKLRIGTVIAVVALVVAVASLYMVHNIASSRLSCTYLTYINTSCSGHVCSFRIPVESGKWYRIIVLKCRGVGVLGIYYSGENGTQILINSTLLTVVLEPNRTVTLPVNGSAIYGIYVRTTIPVGEASGRVSIVEVS